MNTQIRLKSAREIKKMRTAGRIVAEVLEGLTNLVKPGIRISTLDEYAEELIVRRGAVPAFQGISALVR